LLEYHENGPLGWMWMLMLICNVAVPWLLLWNRRVRRTPWLMAIIGILINVGMWLERYVIVPISLTINRMPFTWRQYVPGIEIPLGIGTLALFILLYMLASRLIPLVPIWEVQEGQMVHSLERVGKTYVPVVKELE
jgi:molybdopterin-containing oxidoreductase family membrane subunit